MVLFPMLDKWTKIKYKGNEKIIGAYKATSLGYVADRTRYKFNTKHRILCDQKDGYKFVVASTDENYSIDDYITMGFSALTESGSILRQKSVVVRFCVKGMMPNTELVMILNLPKDYTVRLNSHLCNIVLTGTALMRDKAQAVSETVNYAVEAFKNNGFQTCDYCGDSDESELYSYRYSFIFLTKNSYDQMKDLIENDKKELSSAGLLALSLLMSQITARIACGFIAAEHNAGFFMGFLKAGTVMDNSRAASNIYITNGITLLAAIVALSSYLNFSKGQFDLKKSIDLENNFTNNYKIQI